MTDTGAAAPRNDLLAGIAAAAVGALVGAALWALLVSVTSYKIGFAAVGVGALTGLLAGRSGAGAPQLPVVAAVIGLVGCVLGDLLADAHQVARAVGQDGGSVSMLTVFKDMVTDPGLGWDVYRTGFAGLDLLFYALAAQAAFRLAHHHPQARPAVEPAGPAPWDAPVEPDPEAKAPDPT